MSWPLTLLRKILGLTELRQEVLPLLSLWEPLYCRRWSKLTVPLFEDVMLLARRRVMFLWARMLLLLIAIFDAEPMLVLSECLVQRAFPLQGQSPLLGGLVIQGLFTLQCMMKMEIESIERFISLLHVRKDLHELTIPSWDSDGK